MNKIVLINKIRKAIINYPQAILDYRRYFKDLKSGKDTSSKGSALYKLRNGLKFQTRKGTGDIFALCEIAATDVYHLESIRKGDIVVDIGTHIGLFSILASQRASSVLSLEPVPENFSLFKRNIEINKINNIKPIQAALSNKTGNIKIHTGDNTVAHSIINKKGKKGSITVPTISLSALMKKEKIKKIDFLKMDCEGAEYEILFNLPKSILKKIRTIHLEAHSISPSKNKKTMAQFLQKNGFKIKTKYGMIYAENQNN